MQDVTNEAIIDAYRIRLREIDEEIEEEMNFLRFGTQNTTDPEAFHVLAGVERLIGMSREKLEKLILNGKSGNGG